jgi:DMSO/TMAO reductase YedYZ molybdopterin-dependent catalytic subunit
MRNRSWWWLVIGPALMLTFVPGVPRASERALEISGPGLSRAFGLADLRKLRSVEGPAGAKSSTGKIIAPRTYRGVALKDVLAACARFDSTMGVSVEARDGYGITLSYAQVMAGDFTAYDPSTGKKLAARAPLTAVLAYECEGATLDPEKEGALRLVIVSPRKDVVTDGHWWVKWVTKLKLEPASGDWALRLDGALAELVDRSTFESCASPGCHGTAWRDDAGREWSGLPLWLLVGRVDDAVSHGDRAFNDSLAHRGYVADVMARDGGKLSFASARLARSGGLVVAHRVDGEPLAAAAFPLRLVGPGLAAGDSLGGIERVLVHVPAAAGDSAGGRR